MSSFLPSFFSLAFLRQKHIRTAHGRESSELPSLNGDVVRQRFPSAGKAASSRARQQLIQSSGATHNKPIQYDSSGDDDDDGASSEFSMGADILADDYPLPASGRRASMAATASGDTPDHYPDYRAVPQLPALPAGQQGATPTRKASHMAAAGSKAREAVAVAEAEVMLSASRLQIESET